MGYVFPKLCAIELVRRYLFRLGPREVSHDNVAGLHKIFLVSLGGLVFKILSLQNLVPLTNSLSDSGKSVLILKVNEEAFQEKYGWISRQAPSSGLESRLFF